MRNTRVSTTLMFLLTNSFATPALAQIAAAPSSISFDAALRAAEERSLFHVHHASEADAARDMAVAAGQLPDPVLHMSVDNLVVDGPDNWSFAQEPMSMAS